MTESRHSSTHSPDVTEPVSYPRLLALAGTMTLLGSFLVVLRDVVGTVGNTIQFYLVVAAVFLVATLLAQVVRVATAAAVGAVLLVLGSTGHFLTLDTEIDLLVLVSNNVELLTGETVLRIQKADVWALTVTPGPLFVTWFFALRRRYVTASMVGGGMLTYLVLTGDAGTTVTLLGIVGASVSVAFGEIEATGWSSAADRAVVVLAVMVLAPLVITVVPGGAANPVSVLEGQETNTMEANVVGSDTTLEIVGDVEQSPEPRFTVESDQPRFWRTGSYDRYTGDGWVQTGSASPLSEQGLSEPPGNTTELMQRIEVEQPLTRLPTAWRPTSAPDSIAEQVRVGPGGGLTLAETVAPGTKLEVTSVTLNSSSENLSAAGENYPADVFEEYTQLPESTPDRVRERTARITQNADTPYETALTIEDWLESNKEYSLDIDKPEGDIADSFLFEMDAGYCTYYATTMATMLRSQDIPARMVVGYTPGEPVDSNEYLVRGLNSHAWVEVYFPDIGWVEFDPTPATPRQNAEEATFEGGSGGQAQDVPGLQSPMESPAQSGRTGSERRSSLVSEQAAGQQIPGDVERTAGVLEPDGGENATLTNGTNESSVSDDTDSGFSLPLPSREQLAVALVGIVGVAAWARQSQSLQTVSRRLLIRFRRRSDPETDIERIYERLMLILEQRYRSRNTGETMHQYLDDIYASEEARHIVELREQARYGGTVTEAEVDTAVELVESIRDKR